MKFIQIFIFLFIFSIQNLFAFDKVIFTDEEKKFIKQTPIINVGLEKDWPPFDYVEEGEHKGLAKDYLALLEQITSLKFNYQIDTWDNLLKKTKNKDLDLLPILVKNSKREKYLSFTNSYLSVRDYVFAKNSSNITSINSFKDKTVAIIKGYAQEEYFKNNYPDTKILLVNNSGELIDAMITNKADFIISNSALINYLMNKYNFTNIDAKFHMNYDGNKLYMAVREDYLILRDIIQKSLDSITFKEKNSISSKWINFSNKINSEYSLILTKKEKEYLKNKKTISIANEYDWVPFDYNEKNIPKGYVIDYMKLLSKKLGLETIFVTDKWSTLVKRLKNKEIDILPVIGYNKKREGFLNYTQSYINQILSIVTKKSVSNIINIDDLENKKIGMIKGWHLTNLVKKNHPNINVIEFEALKDVFDAIRDNFIDATIQNDLIAKYYINKNYPNDLHTSSHLQLEGFSGKLYMGIRKDLNILTNIYIKAIKSVTKEEIKLLDKKWINISKNMNFTEEESIFIEKNKIKVTSTKNWAPFNFLDNNSALQGITVDFWKYIVDKANLKTEFLPKKTFAESINSIKNKENDIIMGTSKTKERTNYSIFSETYLTSLLGIATLHDKNYIKNASELLNKKIAVGRSFSAHKLLEEKYPNMNFVFVNNPKEGLEYLSENKVYAYIDIMPVLTHNIKHLGFTNIKITGQTGIEFNFKFMIRDDYTILLSIIDKVLKNMPQEDKERIYNKWLKIDFQKAVDYSLIWKLILVFVIILLLILYKNKKLFDYQKNLKKTQKELEKSLENFKSLIDLNIAGIIIIEDKKVKYLNTAIVKMLAYENKSQLINRTLDYILKENKLINIYDKKLHDNYEMEAIKVDGVKIPVLLTTKEINFDNKPSYIISIINLTEIKNKEEMMVQQSKMASLGEMIGNIAHQWRQPLSSISTAASGIKVQKEYNLLSDQMLNSNLDSIIETTQFLSQTINDFQNYIKVDKKKITFDIKNSIDKVLTIINASLKNNFINTHTNIKSAQVNGYENELNQALLNILTNSKDALSEKEENKRDIFINSYSIESFAIIEIIDNAGGIDKTIIQKVFEPYFTTKHKSQGTGLGLYMTHKIITDSMKGSIRIKTCTYNNEVGTKVTLHIPL